MNKKLIITGSIICMGIGGSVAFSATTSHLSIWLGGIITMVLGLVVLITISLNSFNIQLFNAIDHELKDRTEIEWEEGSIDYDAKEKWNNKGRKI